MTDHYPYAWQDTFDVMLREAHAQGEDAYRAEIDRIARFLAVPANQYRPLPQARRFHQSQKRIRLALGGNRSSKSQSMCQEIYWMTTGYHPWRDVKVPQVGFYACPTWELVGNILFPKFKTLLSHLKSGRDYMIAWRNRARAIPAEIHIRIGGDEHWKESDDCSKIIFKSFDSEVETFQGVALDFVGLDEQVPQQIWNEINSRAGAGQRLDIMGAFTPIRPQPWMEERLTVDKPDAWDIFEYPLDDNRISEGGFIDDALIDAMIAEWPEEVIPTRRLGKWGSYAGVVYKSFARETHVVKEADEGKFLQACPDGRCIVPPVLRSVGAIDFGAANPLAFIWAVKLPSHDDAWYIFDEYWHDPKVTGLRLLKDHAAAILKRTTERWRTVFSRVYADHDCQDRFELESNGLSTIGAKKDVAAGIECVQRYMKVQANGRPRLFVAERCKNLIRELISYHWPEGTDIRDPRDEPVKVDDHCADCLKYLCWSHEQSVPSGKRVSLGSDFRRQF